MNVAVIGELLFADTANALLFGDFAIHELPHLCVRPEFTVPSGMMLILNAPNTDLALPSLFWDGLPCCTMRRLDDKSRMSGDVHVRICERLGV